MPWESTYDSKGFDEAQAKYDVSPLLDYDGRVGKPAGYKIYISKLQRTYDTAMQVFDFNPDSDNNLSGGNAHVQVVDLDEVLKGKEAPAGYDEELSHTLFSTELLNEVPKRSYKDTDSKISKAVWTARSRIQWFFNNRRQPEVKTDTVKRAERIADILEAEGRDCVLISHEFFLYTLKGVLEKRGFLIERSSTGRIKNWERIRASKRDIHCGVCGHNCLLTNPGCSVGRDAAMRQGIKFKQDEE